MIKKESINFKKNQMNKKKKMLKKLNSSLIDSKFKNKKNVKYNLIRK